LCCVVAPPPAACFPFRVLLVFSPVFASPVLSAPPRGVSGIFQEFSRGLREACSDQVGELPRSRVFSVQASDACWGTRRRDSAGPCSFLLSSLLRQGRLLLTSTAAFIRFVLTARRVIVLFLCSVLLFYSFVLFFCSVLLFCSFVLWVFSHTTWPTPLRALVVRSSARLFGRCWGGGGGGDSGGAWLFDRWLQLTPFPSLAAVAVCSGSIAVCNDGIALRWLASAGSAWTACHSLGRLPQPPRPVGLGLARERGRKIGCSKIHSSRRFFGWRAPWAPGWREWKRLFGWMLCWIKQARREEVRKVVWFRSRL